MKRIFCDNCEEEITIPVNSEGTVEPMVKGFMPIKNKRFNVKVEIWIDWDNYQVEHLCRNCLIDAIKSFDWRSRNPKVNKD